MIEDVYTVAEKDREERIRILREIEELAYLTGRAPAEIVEMFRQFVERNEP